MLDLDPVGIRLFGSDLWDTLPSNTNKAVASSRVEALDEMDEARAGVSDGDGEAVEDEVLEEARPAVARGEVYPVKWAGAVAAGVEHAAPAGVPVAEVEYVERAGAACVEGERVSKAGVRVAEGEYVEPAGAACVENGG